MADAADLSLFMVTDDVEVAVQHIQRCTIERFGLPERGDGVVHPGFFGRSRAIAPAAAKHVSRIGNA
jgi:hypothetical protein